MEHYPVSESNVTKDELLKEYKRYHHVSLSNKNRSQNNVYSTIWGENVCTYTTFLTEG